MGMLSELREEETGAGVRRGALGPYLSRMEKTTKTY